jgi:hypothetical protein
VLTVLVGSVKGVVGMKQLDDSWRGGGKRIGIIRQDPKTCRPSRDGGRKESACFTLEIMNL